MSCRLSNDGKYCTPCPFRDGKCFAEETKEETKMNGPTAPQLIQKANRLNSEADEKFREGYMLLEQSRDALDQLAMMFGMVKTPTGANETQQ